MTCRGYDAKAVKISKPVKVAAATIMDNHKRGAFIRSFVNIAREQAFQRTSKNRKDKA